MIENDKKAMITFVFATFFLSYIDCDDRPLVQTRLGPVIGKRIESEGIILHVFLGIPFAKPPVGNLRFRLPEPLEPWTTPIKATKFSDKCPADSPFDPGTKSEDCLYLNIWKPAEERSGKQEKKAVMIWIYGGAFMMGSSSFLFYDGQVLSALGDVIVVSMNYRVGVLGFLNLNTSEVPGNQGLHDQALAIKWVKDNIAEFGGDPMKITLFGESAGGISAGYHLVSPISRNLFQRAIMESGCPNDPLVNTDHEKSLRNAQLFAEDAGCASKVTSVLKDSSLVLECLRYLSFQDILRSQSKVSNGSLDTFPPVYGDSFLPIAPYKALMNHKHIGPQKSVMLGVNRDEGTFFLSLVFPGSFFQEKPPIMTKEEARKYIKLWASYVKGLDGDKLADVYLAHGPMDPHHSVAASFGDFVFVCPAILTAEKLANAGKDVYFYIYNYRARGSVARKWMGVTHFEEVPMVFGIPMQHPELGFSTYDKWFSKRILKTWAEFAKNGKPPKQLEQDWHKFTPRDPHYLVLQPERAYEVQRFHESTCKFWRKNQPFLSYPNSGNKFSPSHWLSTIGFVLSLLHILMPLVSRLRGFPAM